MAQVADSAAAAKGATDGTLHGLLRAKARGNDTMNVGDGGGCSARRCLSACGWGSS